MTMPKIVPIQQTETPRGPTATPGIPDRTQEKPPVPGIIRPGDTVNPNDPPIPVVNPVTGAIL